MKNIIILGLLAALLFMFVSRQTAIERERKSSARLQEALQIERDTLKIIRGQNGELRAEKQAIELTAREFALASKNMRMEVDKLSREIGGMKNLISHLEFNFESSDTGTTIINHYHENIGIGGDTVKVGSFDWSNDYLSATGIIHENRLNFQYVYDPGFIAGTLFHVREPGLKGLFKPKKAKISLMVEDPNAKFTFGNGYALSQAKPKFWQTTGFKMGVGVLIGFGLFRFIR